jgi:hypothetical protein
MSDSVVDPALDRATAIDVTSRMGWFTDRKEWAALADVFAPKVTVDYTSLQGGEPAVVSGPDLVAGWKASLDHLAVTQHLLTNHLVTVVGDTAEVLASFQATHAADPADGRRWVLGGDYRFELTRTPQGWRISALTMTARWQTGDPAVPCVLLRAPTAKG